MIAVLLLIIVSISVLYDYKKNYKRISPYSLIATPYLFIILINNNFAVKLGFYSITDQVIIMLMSGLLLFWCGVLLSRLVVKRLNKSILKADSISETKFNNYNMYSMIIYCLFVGIVEAIRILIIIARTGLRGFFSGENEGMVLSGPFGHLLLTIYPLLPIIFYYWCSDKKNRKDKLIIVSFLLCAAELFSTQVKYHVMGLIMLTFIFLCLENKSYLKIGMISLVIIIVLLFAGNYALSFIASDQKATRAFILGHLWKYIAGSLIYDNALFTQGFHVGVSIFYKVGSMLFALPNMFIRALFGITFFSDIEETPFMLVASFGESGNVIDLIGFLYPAKGGVIALLGFAFAMVLFGFFSNAIYIRALKHIRKFTISIAVYLTFFCSLSFFSTFAHLIPPWEILVWSIIMPFIFSKKIKVSYK